MSAFRLPAALRHPRLVFWACALVLLLTGALAVGAPSAARSGGFDDPGSDSARAARLVAANFPAGQADLVLLVQGDGAATVDSPQVTAAGKALLDTLTAQPSVQVVASYFTSADPGLRSPDGRIALTTVSVGGDQDAVARTTARLHRRLAHPAGPITVRFGGAAQVDVDLVHRTGHDLALAGAVALPLLLILLALALRSVLAALLPLFVGLLSVSSSLAVLRGLGQLTSVPVFAVDLAAALGLGLAVDHGLLIVSRYREERAEGRTGPEAVAVTLRTAGRTVVLSGATVAAALATLLVFDQYVLRSFACTGVAVVAVTVLCALLPLPAALLLVGDRIAGVTASRSPRRRRRRSRALAEPTPPEGRFWGRLAGAVMRRPLVAGALVVAALAATAWPLTGARFGIPDERALPRDAESRVVADLLRAGFPDDGAGSLALVSQDWPSAPDGQLAGYAARLSTLPHVTSVTSAAGRFQHGVPADTAGPMPGLTAGGATLLLVGHDTAPSSPDGERLVRAVRAAPVPAGHRVLVGGPPARGLDATASIGARLPLAAGLAALLTLVLLALATGSVLLPAAAVLFSLLGLGAALGATVPLSRTGYLASLFGITPAPIAVTVPALLLCVAYALSMNHALSALSRIKEHHDRTGEARLAARAGLGSGGPVVMTAAAVLAVSFFSTAVSGVSPAELFGLGTGLAVLLDALLLHGVLLPAFLALAGAAAWWAPAWLKRLNRMISDACAAAENPSPSPRPQARKL
ncbi:MMPL family transporter [Kitasatospora sp. NPDC101183]|uniref:MMPL family transporter n=1 Tax=Kitasatospora sp. NPDC101183 TaxID=3364100 RepID=UPI003817083A